MKTIAKIYLFGLSWVIAATAELSAAEGTEVIRPASDWAAWSNESNLIIQFHKTNLKLPKDSKVALLFIAVKLGLNDSVAEKGAALHEFAFVYSEVKDDDGSIKRKVMVMTRDPYLDREWMTESVNLIEGQEPLSNVLTLNDTVDIYTQVSQYAKRVIPPRGSKDYIIAMIVFEEAVIDLLGKNMNDAEVLDLTKRKKLTLPVPE